MNDDSQDPSQDDSQIDLEQLKKDLEVMTETAKRAMADLQNYKRHSEESKKELGVYANMHFLKILFPALDNMHRSLAHIPDEIHGNEWVLAVESIIQGLVTALMETGLELIDAINVPVNPHEHEVLMEGEGPAGEVIEIFEVGYKYQGKTLRPAKVKVGKIS